MAIGATNLDINAIVTQLMAVEQRPLAKLDQQEASYQAKLSAYGSVKGAIASFQSAVQGLNSAGLYQAVKATSSDTSVFSASATSTAVAGTYSLEVSSLTQAQKLVAAGQASSTAAIGTGTATTLTFDFGTISGGTLTPFDPATNTGGTYTGATFSGNGNPSKSITIDSTNNSLQGIRDAINAAGLGVTATIVNDGSGTPYRLSLAADNGGASNSLRITATPGGDASVMGLLEHDPAGVQNLSETVTAQNANIKVNGLSVTKTSNSISDVIEGVTLNLSKVTTSPVTLTVARDTTAISNSVSGFVKAYNGIVSTLKGLASYDPATKQGGILLGDSAVRQLQTQLRNMLNTAVSGTSGALTHLSDVGVSFQKDGTLSLDQTKLNNAISNNFSDIAGLFSSVGRASDSLISFDSASSTAKAGSYAVNITQIATQGNAVGAALTLPATITSGINDTLTLIIDGISISTTLTAGGYATADALAAELQSKINASSALSSAGSSVSVAVSGGALTITSAKYGSTSSVSITGGNAQATLGLSTPTQTAGVDVAGSIGGVTALGEGQKLLGQSGGANGLSIIINGGALGDRGVLTYSNGYAATLSSWATGVLASDGILESHTKGIDASIKDIGKRRDTLNTRLVAIEKSYRAQFTRLDTMLASMNQTSTYLTQQLSQLSKL
jgi:flagellar hook-associated protein 2